MWEAGMNLCNFFSPRVIVGQSLIWILLRLLLSVCRARYLDCMRWGLKASGGRMKERFSVLFSSLSSAFRFLFCFLWHLTAWLGSSKKPSACMEEEGEHERPRWVWIAVPWFGPLDEIAINLGYSAGCRSTGKYRYRSKISANKNVAEAA